MTKKVIKALSAKELRSINGGMFVTGTDLEGNTYIMKPDGMVYRVDEGGTLTLIGDFVQPPIIWG